MSPYCCAVCCSDMRVSAARHVRSSPYLRGERTEREREREREREKEKEKEGAGRESFKDKKKGEFADRSNRRWFVLSFFVRLERVGNR